MIVNASTHAYVTQMLDDARTAIGAAATALDSGTPVASSGTIELGAAGMTDLYLGVRDAALAVDNAIAQSAAHGDARVAALLVREAASLNQTVGTITGAGNATSVPVQMAGTVDLHARLLDSLSTSVGAL